LQNVRLSLALKTTSAPNLFLYFCSNEGTWKTVMQIAKKYAKNTVLYLQRVCQNQKAERIFIDWCWWILGGLPFPHLGERSERQHLNSIIISMFSLQCALWIAIFMKESKYYTALH
jgi:hypothetical protein